MTTVKKILIAGKDNDFANYIAALNACHAVAEISLDPKAVPACDGLLLPGGGDIHPKLYNRPDMGCHNIDITLDMAQLRLLNLFIRAKKPVLGICRGHQMINVYFKGTLIQHMDTVNSHQSPHGDTVHRTYTKPECFLKKIYGASCFATNSCHHQAIDHPGQGLIPIQYTGDGTIEAMIHESLPILSVQWHPERMMLNHLRQDTVSGAPVFIYFCHLAGQD